MLKIVVMPDPIDPKLKRVWNGAEFLGVIERDEDWGDLITKLVKRELCLARANINLPGDDW